MNALTTYGSERAAASALGISRSTLNTKVKEELGLCIYGSCKVPVTDSRMCPEHTQRTKEFRRKNYLRNADHIKSTNRKWEIANHERRKEKKLQNRPSYYARRNPKLRQRLKSDVPFRLAAKLRTRLNMAVRKSSKAGSAVRDLGCTVDELKSYLESRFTPGMTWNNYGRGSGKWNIDHIVPLASVDLTDRDQFLKVCHYSNLQPLWWIDNLRKFDTVGWTGYSDQNYSQMPESESTSGTAVS